ncbi:MAG: hypothetical protein CVT95_04360 [Bacteroidetes bacterium HGW-Bacteroidetes-12]|nr:MAG: hypothetical protein CVT95_04360 [Bacteroidetes bacterium HGW-Bacteroidetes-12]
MNSYLKNIALLFLLSYTNWSIAQQLNLPLNREFNLVNQKAFNNYNAYVHTAFQPMLQSQMDTNLIESLSASEKNDFLINVNRTHIKNRSWVARKLFYENFIQIDTGKFYLTIDPLLNLELGEDLDDNRPEKPTLFVNTRGIIAKGHIGEKFSFQTAVYENQANLPQYLVDYVNTNNVVPGQGRVKKFKDNGFDYNTAISYISYSPNKRLNFQLGNDKQFIGDGYRSLLLSDFAYNYPYYKAVVLFGKKNQFQYTKLNAGLSNLVRRTDISTPEALFTRKSMSVHYLNWIATKWLHLGVFESTIWQTESQSGTKPYNFMQLNPILFLNTLNAGFDGNDNSQLGINTKIKFPFKTIIYGQLMYDGNEINTKYGYQAGIKYFGISGLTLQAEFNKVEPYTFSSELPLQNYSHFNEPLAHPLGANFTEIVGIVNYKYKRIFTQAKATVAQTTSTGSNIFLNHYISTNGITPIIETDIINLQFHIGVLVNPKNNMSIMLGVNNRKVTSNNVDFNTNYIYFAFRTSLRNLYTDF